MAKNPFAKEVASGPEGDFSKVDDKSMPGANYCPFLTCNGLTKIPVEVPAEMLLAHPEYAGACEQGMAPSFVKCLGAKCSMWDAGKSDCLLKLQARAQIRTADALEALASNGALK